MIFYLPMFPMLFIYMITAVLPAGILLRYIYQHDTVEKEPPLLLAGLVLLGAVSAMCAGILEGIAQTIMNKFVAPDNPFYTLLLAFLVVASVEEGVKYIFLKQKTWYHHAFNYRFDGIVYAVFISLGFAAFENIQYVLHYGLSVAMPRALLAIPGHMSFAIVMGVFYGRAKLCEMQGNMVRKGANLWLSYLAAVFLHGFYDACAMTGTVWATILFVVFVCCMYLKVYHVLKKESRTDIPL